MNNKKIYIYIHIYIKIHKYILNSYYPKRVIGNQNYSMKK